MVALAAYVFAGALGEPAGVIARQDEVVRGGGVGVAAQELAGFAAVGGGVDECEMGEERGDEDDVLRAEVHACCLLVAMKVLGWIRQCGFVSMASWVGYFTVLVLGWNLDRSGESAEMW